MAAEGDPAALRRCAATSDADVAIVGGGYTGMWTAYFLPERDRDARIVLLEQDICGGGPSGRNGGFVHGWWESLGYLVEAVRGRGRAGDRGRGRRGGGRHRRVVRGARGGRVVPEGRLPAGPCVPAVERGFAESVEALRAAGGGRTSSCL